MNIRATYSHLNGLEYLQVHLADLWTEIVGVISDVDAWKCKSKVSKEKGMEGIKLYNPVDLNGAFKKQFYSLGWREKRTDYYVTADVALARKTMLLDADRQKNDIEAGGAMPYATYKQTDFVKNGIAVEVQFGKYAFIAYDIFVKHMTFYLRDEINVGVEIMPMKEMASKMSSGIAYYENELHNVLMQGRGTPAVPLVLVGIVP
ncbi:MAG: restriction endonuclease [Synergistaceae bacterium]|jgi:hypothetical protein|nr:restriction endonuclease [Synergistaceae bacterium]